MTTPAKVSGPAGAARSRRPAQGRVRVAGHGGAAGAQPSGLDRFATPRKRDIIARAVEWTCKASRHGAPVVAARGPALRSLSA
jgi:hypothetical protein